MTSRKSTRKRPSKPYPEFPLIAMGNGQWCRKINGKIYYFGPWEDPDAALAKHADEYPYLKAGIPVPNKLTGLTVEDLLSDFLDHKEAERDANQISPEWFADLHAVCKTITAVIPKQRLVESLCPADFTKLRLAIVEKHAPGIARNLISRIRSVFKFGFDNRLVKTPVDFGVGFRPPSKALIRKHRSTQPRKLWKPAEVWTLLESATPVRRAMILLAMNCGFNNRDLCRVPISAFDFAGGWLEFPRAKTYVDRRLKLWPETVAAVKKYLAQRPAPSLSKDSEFLFVTRWGNPWRSYTVCQEFEKVRELAKIEQGAFSWFRHTVQTIGERTGDIVAVRAVMGHVDDSISAEYREGFEDSRLIAVANVLWKWLDDARPKPPKAKTKTKADTKADRKPQRGDQ
jgi:integrase